MHVPAILANTPGLGLAIPLLVLMIALGAVIVSLLGRAFLPNVAPVAIYLSSPVVTAALLYGFYTIQNAVSSARDEASREAYREAQGKLAENIDLKAWWPAPDADDPSVLHLEIDSRLNGALEVRVRMGEKPPDPYTPVNSYLMDTYDWKLRHPLKVGETLVLDVPLRRFSPGKPEAVEIWLTLHEASAMDWTIVTKRYANFPFVSVPSVWGELPPATDPKRARP